MLKGTSHKPTEVIKTLDWPGGKREVTVERVATCAVMAGAKREYLPVILALANYVPFGNSTSSMANIIVVNGPIRNEIGMNYGTNAMGPHNEANSVIGRTYTLMSKTIGGLHSEKTTWSSLGSTMQYNNVCIAENEQALPEGWSGRLYAITAIYAPLGLRDRIAHRWYQEGRLIYSSASYSLTGGRAQGFRVWTSGIVRNLRAGGRIRVDVETEAGQLVGRAEIGTAPTTAGTGYN